ncbi:unnamed protein product [Amaranthus hypochondriacus]
MPGIEEFELIWKNSFTILPLTLFVFFLIKWLHTKSSTGKRLPPSPRRLPILGNLHQIGTQPHRSLQSLSRQYGDLMLIYLGKSPFLIVSSSKVATEIMRTHDVIFSNRPILKTLNKLLYDGKDVAAAQYGWLLGGNIVVRKMVVEEHEKKGESERRKYGMGENGEKVMDIVDVLLDVQKENTTGFAIDRDSIKALILDIFSGGTDTTYTVLEWAMTEMLKNPRVMKELQREVRQITGEKSYVNEDDLEQMKYLKAVIKETLRLHPPIPLLVPRRSQKDIKINGYHIPAGVSVITNAWAIHRDPASWDEPERFNPERFLNSQTDFRGQDFELIPFGAGRRICPGITFAIANNELVLANLVLKYNWRLPDGVQGDTLDMSECIGLTKHRKTPLLAIPTHGTVEI